MSQNREQSAIDAIYELLDEVKDIKKEMKIIDNNIKLLNNKVAKLSTSAVPAIPSAGVPRAVVPSAPTAIAPRSVPESTEEPVKMIKLFGRIKNQRKKPIKGVYIKIYDPKGNVIKSRETDSKGYWEARVSVGKYVVELDAQHINRKFLPKNFNIEVDETMNEFEVK